MQILGLEIEAELPEGVQPVEILCIVKCLAKEGADFPFTLFALASPGLSTWEGEGMARWAGREMDRGTDSEAI